MRPGQLRPGVRQPRELAGTAPFSSWSEKSENRATPYALGPRFLPFYTITPWNTLIEPSVQETRRKAGSAAMVPRDASPDSLRLAICCASRPCASTSFAPTSLYVSDKLLKIPQPKLLLFCIAILNRLWHNELQG